MACRGSGDLGAYSLHERHGSWSVAGPVGNLVSGGPFSCLKVVGTAVSPALYRDSGTVFVVKGGALGSC